METTDPPKTIDDIPNDILNHILELVVIHRSPVPGEQLPIQVPRDVHNAAKACLPASRTCKGFMVIVAMFFGLNIFEVVQRTARFCFPGPNSKKDWIDLSSLKILESGWIWDRDITQRLQHSVILPPSHYLHAIKNITVQIKILPNIVVGNPTPEQCDEMIGGTPSWLFAIGQLVRGVLPNLDSLKINIYASKELMLANWPEAQVNRELARSAAKEYMEDQVPKIGAKKVVVKYSGDWEQYF